MVNPLLYNNAIPEELDTNGYDSDEFYGLDVADISPSQTDDDFRYLNNIDRLQVLESPIENWTSCLISKCGEMVEFNLDSSRKDAWKTLQDEVSHIRQGLPQLLCTHSDPNGDDTTSTLTDISLENLVDLAFGEKNEISTLVCKELMLDRVTFAKFMGNLCLQMSYKETPSSLYDEDSELASSTLIDMSSYMEIWKKIATKKKVCLNDFVGSSRRDKCLWESMETAANKFLRSISIAKRKDDIVIALDDDKIWVESSGANGEDDFGLRKVTHVKDNRKGIIAHTAVSSTTNIPLCFMFERKGDTAVSCFTRIFGQMFPPNSSSDLPDLNGITNHSDRGYTIASTVFDFLLPAGAEFTNTVKRIMPFPYIWGMKTSTTEQREKLDEKGAPTLYVKEITKHGRLVTCAAFRTGTNNISAVVTSTVHGHQWEGICLNPRQRIIYENDQLHGLDSLLFQLLAGSSLVEIYKDEMNRILDDLKNQQIDVLTLEQGTADWHKGRQFSLTSSQSDDSFRMAFIIHKEDDDWCSIAEYLYGEAYYESKSLVFNYVFVAFLFLKCN
jgi:hypothetical protein